MEPFKKNDWVAQTEVAQPHFGKIVEVFQDGDEWLINICMYDLKGNKVGRWSEAQGGPTSFEPACPASSYRLIQAPRFPIERLGLYGNYDHLLK